MIDKTAVENMANAFLEGGDLFLVKVEVGKDNTVNVFIDGDEEVKIQDCIDLSRKIEAGLDRDKEDFELSVLSWGLGEPLLLKRQYIKNIGQRVELITTQGEKLEGVLTDVKEETIVLEPRKRPLKGRMPKSEAKKGESLSVELEFERIKTIKVTV